jgi:two-component system, OmpR family, sensor kinase
MSIGSRLRFRPSAGARVALAVTASIALSTIIVSAIAYVAVARHLAADLEYALFREAEAYKAAVWEAAWQGPDRMLEASKAYMGNLSNPRSGRSEVILLLSLPGGEVLSQAPTSVATAIRAQTVASLEATGRAWSDVEIGDASYRVATVPIPDEEGNNVAVFQAAAPTAAVEERLSDLAWALARAGFLVIVAGALASRWVARRTLRPLHRAAATAGEVTDSSLSRRVAYDGPRDSVGLLVESLNRMLDRLERSFAEQRRFVSDASHEMRTPITIVRGHLDVMRRDPELMPTHADTLDLAEDELLRMSNVIEDLLSLARLEAGALPPFGEIDLAEVVEEALFGAQTLGDRRFSFIHGGPLPVLGNRDLLLQAVLNLLANAVRHTDGGGRVIVSCEAEGNWARVTVADDGPGIPESDLERIFDRFYRVPGSQRGESGAGSGLGLAIARRLVQLHGGSLIAANSPDGGAVFDLTLPLLEG